MTSRYLFVRLADGEKADFVALARELGLSQSALLRMLIKTAWLLLAKAREEEGIPNDR